MCVYSMILDHYHDKWKNLPTTSPTSQPAVSPSMWPVPVLPTSAEIEEFRKLLERAREYDKRTGQQDCEVEEKKQLLQQLAEKLGVEIEFP